MMRLGIGLTLSTAFVFGALTFGGKAYGAEASAVQNELLELAFSGVSEMPLRPHIKNRSRAQLKVAKAALTLNCPEMAETYVADIQNWERWMGYAEIAAYYADHGDPENAHAFLDKVTPALKMSEDIRSGVVAASTENPLIDTLVDRRYELVLTRVEEARRILNATELSKAEELQFGAENAASLNANAAAANAANTAEAIAALKPFMTHDNFEIAYYGFHELAKVIDLHYADVDINEMLEEEVKPRLTKVPVFLRIDLYVEFAQVALKHHDVDSVLPMLEELESMVEDLKARPRYYIPESARVLRLMIEVNQKDKVVKALADLQTYYDEKRNVIANIERAELVCAMAEIQQLLGNSGAALELYGKAVAEGAINPNSRPQADDLNRICCSMALLKVEPNEYLWGQLREMRNGLGEPW